MEMNRTLTRLEIEKVVSNMSFGNKTLTAPDVVHGS